MIHLLRQVNSFYSNKIEGNPTLPDEVLRAEENPTGENTPEALMEIKRHIVAQRRLSADSIDEIAICTRDCISRMHRELYGGLPEGFMHIKANDAEATALLSPGEFRTSGGLLSVSRTLLAYSLWTALGVRD